MIKNNAGICINLRKERRKPVFLIMTAFLSVIFVLFTASCNSSSGVKGNREVTFHLIVGKDVNPNMYGEAAPLNISVYSMTTSGFPVDEDYFDVASLRSAPESSGLKEIYSLVMQPGETRTLKLKVDSKATAVGVTGGFRDIENAQWKSSRLLPDYQEPSVLKKIFTRRNSEFYARFNGLGVTLGDTE